MFVILVMLYGSVRERLCVGKFKCRTHPKARETLSKQENSYTHNNLLRLVIQTGLKLTLSHCGGQSNILPLTCSAVYPSRFVFGESCLVLEISAVEISGN